MKTIKSSTICVLCLIALALVLSTAISAQQEPAKAPAAAKQKEKEAEQRQELEKKTRALLHDVASAAWSLKLPENRIFVMTSTADLLWALDEKRARNLYWEAINSINLLAPTVRRSDENLPKAERLKDLQAYTLVFGLRRNILRQVAQRDPQLALEMLRATRQVPPLAIQRRLCSLRVRVSRKASRSSC
jgi:glucose/arabinose dehydrogenase